MNTVAIGEPRIVSIKINDDTITADLADGRTISEPLAWSWRLCNATARQRNNYRIIGAGEGIHWPDIDEDISARGMLEGMPAPAPRDRKARGKTKQISSNHGRRTR